MKNFIHIIKTSFGAVRYVWTRESNGKKYVVLRLVLSILNSFIPLIFMIVPGQLINELTGDKNVDIIVILVSLLVLTPLLIYVINKLAEYWVTSIVSEFNIHSEQIICDRVANMDFEELEKPDVQQLRMRASDSLERVLSVVDIYCNFISSLIQFGLIISVVLTLSVWVILLVVLFVVINSLASKWLIKKGRESQLKSDILNRKRTTFCYIFEELWFAKEIRLFNSKDFLLTNMTQNSRDINENDLAYKRKEYKANFVPLATKFIQQIAVYSCLIVLVIKNVLSVGTMTIYISSVEQLSSSLNSLSNAFLSIYTLQYGLKDIQNFFAIPLRQIESGSMIPVFDSDSTIEFRNVSFKYPGSEKYALQKLNIVIHGNQRLCIVGENGSGKSTFIKLLTRLYYPTEGEILLNGKNIYDYSYQEYIRMFAPIFQDFCRYSFELINNICFDNHTDYTKFNDAVKDAGITELISSLPKKEHTYIGKWIDENGFEPSGGEGQRIAIARALYHGGEIYLLDEPTAALDPKAEYEIYMQFHNMIKGKCAVLITHRLSAVQLADKVAVFDNGHVAEYGTHRDLYAQGGLYTEMFDKQAQFYRDDPQ